MNLSIAVMHCDWVSARRVCVSDMRRQVNLEVVKDNQKNLWHTARRAYRARGAAATHHLVLQDDISLCEGFLGYAQAAIEAVPDAPLSLFSFQKTATARALAAGHSWYSDQGPGTGQAIVLPVDLLQDFLSWERQYVLPEYKHDDGRLRMWSMCRGLQFMVTVPSLVEHVEDKASVAGNHPPISRRAAALVKRGELVDWTRGAAEPTRNRRADAFAEASWKYCKIRPQQEK